MGFIEEDGVSDREFIISFLAAFNVFAMGFHIGMFFGFRKKPRKAKEPPKA